MKSNEMNKEFFCQNYLYSRYRVINCQGTDIQGEIKMIYSRVNTRHEKQTHTTKKMK